MRRGGRTDSEDWCKMEEGKAAHWQLCGAPVCVCRVFIFKAPGYSPLQGQPACAKMAAYPDPPPVIPVPESLADPGAS